MGEKSISPNRAIAQLVARIVRDDEAVGSSPTSPTIILFVPRLGIEPRYTASKAVVLPLDDLGIWFGHLDFKLPSHG